MTSLRILFHMMKADYLERVRRYSFLITVLVSIFIVFKYIPSSNDNYLTLSLHGIRGIYNSAWVGSAIAVLASMLLSLPAFFLLNNAIERDMQTGVGQIIATTPITRWIYTMGKMWSNLALLMTYVAVLIVSAIAMQLIRGEAYTIDLVNLLFPFLYSTLPTMALVASIAILFESVPLLRKGIGNFIYFILWGVSLKFSTTAIHSSQDMLGLSPILNRLSSEANARLPHNDGGHISGISPLKEDLLTYNWNGVNWTLQMFLERYIWLAVAVVIVVVASIFFHRFDLTRSSKINIKGKHKEFRKAELHIKPVLRNDIQIKLTPYNHTQGQSSYIKTLAMELRLMLKGLHFWWYLIALVLIVLGLLLAIDDVIKFVLPFTWVWPILIWSSMGTNETYHRTHQLIFTAMHPVRNQFIVLWMSGIIVAYLTGSGAMIHFLVAGEWESLTTMAVGGLFIPTLAIALGVWSGNGKLFQVVFMLMWYLGPLNKWGIMDFIGTTQQSLDRGYYRYYLLVTLILLLLSVIGRVRQVKAYN
ncbi:hypothetical protein HMPREF1210_01416 [Paenisporosarcina sp. HGH0030]|uniref:ABC transporter permease n=1 Tax=Paenisporosarcina sp. HGH0030 TaxID=1078085 RepID=UPI00034EBF5A|nr:hypothetical protein [Paenisporosarcina sp. HGH0030]EPD52063.1 hypothetical protein HMPREF1210_01416 [Paenisporosarcina sp. HGH0030]